jgi:hypothetical protein
MTGYGEKKANEQISATQIGMDSAKHMDETVLCNFILTDNRELEGAAPGVA